MPVRRRTTNPDIKKLRELAILGVTRADAARQMGMSKEAVLYWDRQLGLGLALARRSPRPVTAMDLARLRALTADGDAPICAVARALGIGRATVRFWGRRLGLTFAVAPPAKIGIIPISAIQRAVLAQ